MIQGRYQINLRLVCAQQSGRLLGKRLIVRFVFIIENGYVFKRHAFIVAIYDENAYE